jgi:hypothetical protein
VVAARELSGPVHLGVERVPRAELVQVALRQVDEQAPPPVLAERSRVLVALGLVPEGFDLREAIVDSLRSRLLGLYDPDGRRVLVAGGVDPALETATRLHELAHGLVDRHFGLAARFDYREGQSDRLSALAALAEGDATSVGLDLESRITGTPREQLLATFVRRTALGNSAGEVAPVVQCLLAAPYRDGLAFVEALRAAGGWSAVDAAWRDPPETSEQVLHPVRYERREAALKVPRPELPEPGCKESLRETLGEATLACIVSEWLGGPDAAATVAGWGGDEVATFACPGGHWVELTLAGDDPEAGARLVRALRGGIESTRCVESGSAETEPEPGFSRILLPPGDRCALFKRAPPERALSGSGGPR